MVVTRAQRAHEQANSELGNVYSSCFRIHVRSSGFHFPIREEVHIRKGRFLSDCLDLLREEY